MKLVCQEIQPDGPGQVKLIPEENEDLWHAYNMIEVGDHVMADTCRKVFKELASGDREAEKVHVELEVVVEDVDYKKDASCLRIRGKNTLKNEHVEIGAFHTLEIQKDRPFVLRKVRWDAFSLGVLKQACEPAASADLAVVLMQEGFANIFLVGKSVTTTCSQIRSSIPRKHGSATGCYEKALNKFFEKVAQAFMRNIDFDVVRCVVIASPGFTKDIFHDYLLLEAERNIFYSRIKKNKSRIILTHATSGYKHSLRETLNAPDVMKLIKDTKAAQEGQVLKDFFDMLVKDTARACYGPKHVEIAHEQRAIKTLLITDDLFRNSEIETRRNYIDLVESVKASGGEVHIFSTMHTSGEQLAQFTGTAAILWFPLPELDDIEM